MSSDYHLICLSHDPALVIDPDNGWHSGRDGRAVAEAMLMAPANSDREEVRAHASCDLVIGQYSNPLVQVGWRAGGGRVDWVDAAWLRPLAMLTHEPTGVRLPYGWTWTGARRLRGELRINENGDERV